MVPCHVPLSYRSSCRATPDVLGFWISRLGADCCSRSEARRRDPLTAVFHSITSYAPVARGDEGTRTQREGSPRQGKAVLTDVVLRSPAQGIRPHSFGIDNEPMLDV